MRTITTTFEEVSLRGEKTVKCGGCGKRLVRRTTLTNTINPWNLNKQGKPKTREEILVKLRKEREDWIKEKEFCKHCEK